MANPNPVPSESASSSAVAAVRTALVDVASVVVALAVEVLVELVVSWVVAGSSEQAVSAPRASTPAAATAPIRVTKQRLRGGVYEGCVHFLKLLITRGIRFASFTVLDMVIPSTFG